MKKILKIMLAVLILGSVALPALSCASSSNAATETQYAAVQKGDLTLDITAGGNLLLSNKEDLAIEVSGTQADPVTVREVLVEEGDEVKAGDVLVSLNVTYLEDRVKSQERTVKSAEQSVKTAQSSLNKTIQDNDIRIRNAEVDLETATLNFNKLNYPFNYATFTFDIPAAMGDLNTAYHQLEEAQAGLATAVGSDKYLEALDKVNQALQNVSSALERLSRGQSVGAYQADSVSQTVSDYTAARSAKISMDKAQYSLEQAKTSSQIALDSSNLSLENAKEDLADDKENLVEYQADLKKSEVVAPFDGFITAVNVKGGDQVQKGTVAVTLADPAKFEAQIMVGERDIFRVQNGGAATISVDSMSGIVLPAKITHISPTGTVQSGVVNYKVRVELDATPAAPAARQSDTPATGSGQPSASPRAGQFAARQSGSGQASSSAGSPGSGIAALMTSQLREGLSVTVSLVLAQRTGVILVPNQAITRNGRDAQVKVATATGTETRTIKTGISNVQYTEVTEGLVEGERVVVPTVTAPTSTSSGSQQRGNQIIIPGGGIPGGVRR